MSTNPPLPRLKKMIEMVLDENPSLKVKGRKPIQVRNSDIALTIIIWQRWYSVGTNEDSVIHLYRLFDLPREDYIKRVRARFQNNEHKYLPTDPNVLAQRRIEQEYWEEALGYKLTAEEWQRYFDNLAGAKKADVAYIDEAMDMDDETVDIVADKFKGAKGVVFATNPPYEHLDSDPVATGKMQPNKGGGFDVVFEPLPVKTVASRLRAIYLPETTASSSLQKGEQYELEIEPLVFGQPIKLLSPIEAVYPSLLSFNKTWRVIK